MLSKPPELLPERFIVIDEEGYPVIDQLRVTHEEFGHHLLSHLGRDPSGYFYTEADGHWVIVEAFDQPLMAQVVEVSEEGVWRAQMPYQFVCEFNLDSLSVDEWDRFYGRTEKGLPFVMSRKAQALFFEALDEFTDDSVIYRDQEYKVPPWLRENPEASSSPFWQEIFCRPEPPPFELGQANPLLPKVLAQLRLAKQRVMVLGCGSGHDAALFAQQGHLVTAVDFCPEAIRRAKESYAQHKNLRFIQQDIFSLDHTHRGQYDLIFEHTCYCAISPERRHELLKLWLNLLTPDGHLLGIFFAFDQPKGPPFGASEWEIRERLKNSFRFLYWTRWRKSLPRRQGKELVIYGQKKEG